MQGDAIMSDQSTPGPVRFIIGLCQLFLGFVISMIGAVLSVFPLTALIGRPITKGAMQPAHNGGANIGLSIASIFRSKPKTKTQQSTIPSSTFELADD